MEFTLWGFNIKVFLISISTDPTTFNLNLFKIAVLFSVILKNHFQRLFLIPFSSLPPLNQPVLSIFCPLLFSFY